MSGDGKKCDHLPDLLIPSDEAVECPSCGARWVREEAPAMSKFADGGIVNSLDLTLTTVPLPSGLARLLANPPEFKGEFKGGRWDGLEVTYSAERERDELLRCVRGLEAAIYDPDLPAENDTERLAMVHGSLRSTLMWICDRRGYPEGGLDA